MKGFKDGQKVRVIVKGSALFGKTGTIARLRISDSGAWVAMDAALPKGMASFPKNDPRGRHVLLYPEECEAA